ncbi:hypothetical protein ACOME3_003653 [Neoechinorhynchus agilis]
MKREYNTSEFKHIVDTVRYYLPNAYIATDIICGYPSETDEDFELTVKLIDLYKFPSLFINQYYSRPGTAAANMKQLPSKIKKQRTKIASEHFKSQVAKLGSWARVRVVKTLRFAMVANIVNYKGKDKSTSKKKLLKSPPSTILSLAILAGLFVGVGSLLFFGSIDLVIHAAAVLVRQKSTTASPVQNEISFVRNTMRAFCQGKLGKRSQQALLMYSSGDVSKRSLTTKNKITNVLSTKILLKAYRHNASYAKGLYRKPTIAETQISRLLSAFLRNSQKEMGSLAKDDEETLRTLRSKHLSDGARQYFEESSSFDTISYFYHRNQN